jgi:hypothetical protein
MKLLPKSSIFQMQSQTSSKTWACLGLRLGLKSTYNTQKICFKKKRTLLVKKKIKRAFKDPKSLK